MFRFRLNKNLQKYIREVKIEHNPERVMNTYLSELEQTCDVFINIFQSKILLSSVILSFDWENNCLRLSDTVKNRAKRKDSKDDRLNNIIDLNTFKIPFEEVLAGSVKINLVWYGQPDVTSKYIEAIQMYSNNDLVGYMYEFIPEAFEHPTKYIYKINNVFYDVSLMSPRDREPYYKISMDECSTGQYRFCTAYELLRGADDCFFNCKKDSEGFYVPKLEIEKYEKVKGDNEW